MLMAAYIPCYSCSEKHDIFVGTHHHMETLRDQESIHHQDGQLSYIGQDCFAIPSILGKIYGSQTRRLDLSFNNIRSLDNLELFPALEELILDNNDLNDLVSFIPLPRLHTLSLNKNHFLDLETLLKQLSRCYPELTYLSLLGNPACPDQLSNLEKDEEDYQRYRYYILHQIPNLKFLDSTPVKAFEKLEAKRIGSYMKVARPKVDIAQEASDEIADSRYSPLPPNMKREGTHRGSFGRLRQRYTGTQSEGNRFIRDNEL
ncbi:leucine-rich melanocyte differentiation-associated protein-like isoform X2 [Stegodyphus dumicola]|uniref:leucine-rich melanocyte differentiation-associated protein-like isoform X2 n=1 Tax=Stegodyphus dumicola TaxID=202533 RepID=UPI0015AE15BC|nr:leucine-rich melanocyte differentiation-associated protein-like isoform X2 [Stegodyphus dumicola]